MTLTGIANHVKRCYVGEIEQRRRTMQNADHITDYYYHRYYLAMAGKDLVAASKFYRKARRSDR
jgi:hypothetical protein